LLLHPNPSPAYSLDLASLDFFRVLAGFAAVSPGLFDMARLAVVFFAAGSFDEADFSVDELVLRVASGFAVARDSVFFGATAPV
jgi:hypothetical protein